MLKLILPITALLLGVALLLLGSGLLNTLLALRAGLEGYSDSTIGMIMSGYFLGFFGGTFVALPLIQRVGHIRTFACSRYGICTGMYKCHPITRRISSPWCERPPRPLKCCRTRRHANLTRMDASSLRRRLSLMAMGRSHIREMRSVSPGSDKARLCGQQFF